MPGSTVLVVIVMRIPRLLVGSLPKQALAWYASTVTDAADSADPNADSTGRPVVLVTGGVRGVGAGISAVFAEQGATVVTCARRPVEGLPYEFHSCDVRDDDSVKALIDADRGRARPARRRGQQRRRFAVRARRRCLGEVQHARSSSSICLGRCRFRSTRTP